METITLTRNEIMWSATFSDPKIVELFGTDTLPTPYKATKPITEMVALLQSLNPNCIIKVK